MLEAGRYTARAVEAALGYTNGGKEQVAVLFEVTQGDAAGSQITWYGYFTEKTTDRTIESLRACGWTGDNIADLSGLETEEVSIVVKHEPHFETGEPTAKVQWVNRLGAGAIAMKSKMEPGQALAFAQRMRGQVLSFDKRSNGGRAPSTKPATATAQRPPQGFVGREPGCDDGPTGANADDLPF